MYYVKLTPNANCFYDMGSRTFLAPNMVLAFEELPRTKGFKTAIKNKVVLAATEEEYLATKETPVETPAKHPLMDLSIKDILKKYSFLDLEDMVEAKKLKEKSELIKFLTTVEKDY
jgi:hypothetical protein